MELNFEGWEGVSKVKGDEVEMGGKALQGLYKETEDIKSSVKEKIKIRCDWRLDIKWQLASDVAEKVSSAI